jgi:hypothetical protein
MDANFIHLLNEIQSFDVAFDNLLDRCNAMQDDCVSIILNKANNNDNIDAMQDKLFSIDGLMHKWTDNGGDAPMDLSTNSHRTRKVSCSNSDSHNDSEDTYTLTGFTQGHTNASTFTHYQASMENEHMHPCKNLTKGKPDSQTKPRSGEYQYKDIDENVPDPIKSSSVLDPPNIKVSTNLVTEVTKMQQSERTNQIIFSNENMTTTLCTSTSSTTNQECHSNISQGEEQHLQHLGEQQSLGLLHAKNKRKCSNVYSRKLGKDRHNTAQQRKNRKYNCHSDTKMQHITGKHKTTKKSIKTTAHTSTFKPMVKNRGPMETMYTCVVCQKQFIDVLHLSQHTNAHLETHQENCTICSEKFLSKENLKLHMMVHCLVSPFPCGHCTYTFTSRHALMKHIKAHHKEHKRYECSFCGKVYIYRKHFLRHLEQHKS